MSSSSLNATLSASAVSAYKHGARNRARRNAEIASRSKLEVAKMRQEKAMSMENAKNSDGDFDDYIEKREKEKEDLTAYLLEHPNSDHELTEFSNPLPAASLPYDIEGLQTEISSPEGASSLRARNLVRRALQPTRKSTRKPKPKLREDFEYDLEDDGDNLDPEEEQLYEQEKKEREERRKLERKERRKRSKKQLVDWQASDPKSFKKHMEIMNKIKKPKRGQKRRLAIPSERKRKKAKGKGKGKTKGKQSIRKREKVELPRGPLNFSSLFGKTKSTPLAWDEEEDVCDLNGGLEDLTIKLNDDMELSQKEAEENVEEVQKVLELPRDMDEEIEDVPELPPNMDEEDVPESLQKSVVMTEDGANLQDGGRRSKNNVEFEVAKSVFEVPASFDKYHDKWVPVNKDKLADPALNLKMNPKLLQLALGTVKEISGKTFDSVKMHANLQNKKQSKLKIIVQHQHEVVGTAAQPIRLSGPPTVVLNDDRTEENTFNPLQKSSLSFPSTYASKRRFKDQWPKRVGTIGINLRWFLKGTGGLRPGIFIYHSSKKWAFLKSHPPAPKSGATNILRVGLEAVDRLPVAPFKESDIDAVIASISVECAEYIKKEKQRKAGESDAEKKKKIKATLQGYQRTLDKPRDILNRSNIQCKIDFIVEHIFDMK